MMRMMDATNTTNESIEKFIQRWHQAAGSELATAQSFVIELCELLSSASKVIGMGQLQINAGTSNTLM